MLLSLLLLTAAVLALYCFILSRALRADLEDLEQERYLQIVDDLDEEA